MQKDLVAGLGAYRGDTRIDVAIQAHESIIEDTMNFKTE